MQRYLFEGNVAEGPWVLAVHFDGWHINFSTASQTGPGLPF